jgi:hypothetical protein
MAVGLLLSFAPGAAQADEIDAAFARMSELAAEERAALDGLPELRQRVETTRLGFEASQRDPDEDELGSDSDVIDVALADAYRDLDALGRELARLNTERALLQSWYDGFVPIAANLGPRQFARLSEELARLRAAGTLRPSSPAALGDMRAVRDRLATLTAEARGLGERDAAERARLHARIDELQHTRDALELARNERPLRYDEAALRDWQEAAAELFARETWLEGVRARMFELAEQVVGMLGRNAPPYLAEVKIAAAESGPVYYHAQWAPPTGGGGDEGLKERRLVAANRELTEAIAQVAEARRDFAEPRQYLGERMAIEARIIVEAADQWSTYRQEAIVGQAIVDAAISIAQFLAGDAPGVVVEKTAQIATALEKMTVARAASRGLLQAGAATADELVERAGAALLARTQARRASRAVIETLIEDLVERRVAGGMARDVAERTARNLLDPVSNEIAAELDKALTDTVTDEAIRRAQQRLVRTLEEHGARTGVDVFDMVDDPKAWGVLSEFLPEPTDLAAAKATSTGVASLYDRVLGGEPGLGGIADHTSDWVGSLVGDTIETFGFKGVAYGVLGAEPLSARALARFAQLPGGPGQFFARMRTGFSANASGTLVSILAGGVKALIASGFDRRTNAQADRFWEAYAASGVLQQHYNKLIAIDRQLADLEANLKHARLSVEAELALLHGPRQKSVLVDVPIDNPNLPLVLDFTFSTALARPPRWLVGTTWQDMAPAGPLPTRHWLIRTVGCFLEDGQLRLGLDPQTTPYGALDANPTRPAYKQPGIPEPRNYEPGEDRNHIVKLAFSPGPSPDRPPLAGCWIGMGGMLVLQQSGSGWTGWLGDPESKSELSDIAITSTTLHAEHILPDGRTQIILDAALGPAGRRLIGTWVLPLEFGGPRRLDVHYVRHPRELPPAAP